MRGDSLATKRHKRHKKGKEREKGGENAFNYELHEYTRMGREEVGIRVFFLHALYDLHGGIDFLCGSAALREKNGRDYTTKSTKGTKKGSGSGVPPLFAGERV
jgi:hypothetical protein